MQCCLYMKEGVLKINKMQLYFKCSLMLIHSTLCCHEFSPVGIATKISHSEGFFETSEELFHA